jgi:hypothetical protein
MSDRDFGHAVTYCPSAPPRTLGPFLVGNKWQPPAFSRLSGGDDARHIKAVSALPLGRWGRFFSYQEAALLPRLSILRPRPFGNVRREVFGPLQYPEMEKDYYCDAEYGCSC